MTQQKKADLQRRLAQAPAPQPPADLAHRIKSDIPKHLMVDADRERRRLSKSINFNLRIAASILLLVSGVFVWLRFLVPGSEAPMSMGSAKVATRAATPAAAKTQVAELAADAAADAVAHRDSEPASNTRAYQVAPAAPAPAAPAAAEAQVATVGKREESKDRQRDDSGVVGGAFGEVVEVAASPPPVTTAASRSGSAAITAVQPVAEPSADRDTARMLDEKNRSRRVVEQAASGSTSAATPPAMVAMAPPPPPPVVPAPSDEIRHQAKADPALTKLSAGAKENDAVFGISVSRDAFERVKRAIENGQRPPASSVDVDALTNYFAGPPSKTATNVRVETEGSQGPGTEGGYCCVVRVTIDTPKASAVVGTAARIDVALNPRVVKRHRRIGAGSSPASQDVLRGGISVTALYAVELQDAVRDDDEIAAVTLTYRDSATGETRRLRGRVVASDIQRGWDEVSRRHRLATLGAVWGEELRSGETTASVVAVRAHELATESPDDARARQLNNLVSASSRLRSSSPTGSGR